MLHCSSVHESSPFREAQDKLLNEYIKIIEKKKEDVAYHIERKEFYKKEAEKYYPYWHGDCEADDQGGDTHDFYTGDEQEDGHKRPDEPETPKRSNDDDSWS